MSLLEAVEIFGGWVAFSVVIFVGLMVGAWLESRDDPLERTWRLGDAPDRRVEPDRLACAAQLREIRELPTVRGRER